ncbi:MAG TPA: hypothetical protein VHX18_12315 [Rhizomicrobium sp.]|jgi:hypothetical protein|nr:hypothetical protein [Rhizomicrobium sp.]
MAVPQKLSHLLQLADQGPALRAALAEEVAELLVNWPSDYPESMRGVCEALLTRAAHDVDAATRARLRVRLCSDPELASRVLPRESATQGLIETARHGGDVPALLAERLGVDGQMAAQILDDETGAALAVACKGASLDRAAFSALALLAHPGRDRVHAYAMLDAFDNVPISEACGVLRDWGGEATAAA